MDIADTKAILLVEDSSTDTYLVHRAVEECSPNLLLWTLADGHTALTFLRKDPPFTQAPTPALILVDLRLPTMSGSELLTKIRELPDYRATPVVVLSSTPKEREERHCLQLGADAYVQKSTNFYVLFESVKALVRRELTSVRAQGDRLQ